MLKIDWLLLLTQLPSHPSSLRVNVWRRMKAAGAVSLQNGVWVLPYSTKNEKFLNESKAFVSSEGGSAVCFIARMPDPEVEETIEQLFKKNIEQEYREFIERCRGLTAELERESKSGKYTFAELDENEEEMQKLTSWLRKIKARDFFEAGGSNEASAAMDCCREHLQAFEKAVYKHEGIGDE